MSENTYLKELRNLPRISGTLWDRLAFASRAFLSALIFPYFIATDKGVFLVKAALNSGVILGPSAKVVVIVSVRGI